MSTISTSNAGISRATSSGETRDFDVGSRPNNLKLLRNKMQLGLASSPQVERPITHSPRHTSTSYPSDPALAKHFSPQRPSTADAFPHSHAYSHAPHVSSAAHSSSPMFGNMLDLSIMEAWACQRNNSTLAFGDAAGLLPSSDRARDSTAALGRDSTSKTASSAYPTHLVPVAAATAPASAPMRAATHSTAAPPGRPLNPSRLRSPTRTTATLFNSPPILPAPGAPPVSSPVRLTSPIHTRNAPSALAPAPSSSSSSAGNSVLPALRSPDHGRLSTHASAPAVADASHLRADPAASPARRVRAASPAPLRAGSPSQRRMRTASPSRGRRIAASAGAGAAVGAGDVGTAPERADRVVAVRTRSKTAPRDDNSSPTHARPDASSSASTSATALAFANATDATRPLTAGSLSTLSSSLALSRQSRADAAHGIPEPRSYPPYPSAHAAHASSTAIPESASAPTVTPPSPLPPSSGEHARVPAVLAALRSRSTAHTTGLRLPSHTVLPLSPAFADSTAGGAGAVPGSGAAVAGTSVSSTPLRHALAASQTAHVPSLLGSPPAFPHSPFHPQGTQHAHTVPSGASDITHVSDITALHDQPDLNASVLLDLSSDPPPSPYHVRAHEHASPAARKSNPAQPNPTHARPGVVTDSEAPSFTAVQAKLQLLRGGTHKATQPRRRAEADGDAADQSWAHTGVARVPSSALSTVDMPDAQPTHTPAPAQAGQGQNQLPLSALDSAILRSFQLRQTTHAPATGVAGALPTVPPLPILPVPTSLPVVGNAFTATTLPLASTVGNLPSPREVLDSHRAAPSRQPTHAGDVPLARAPSPTLPPVAGTPALDLSFAGDAHDDSLLFADAMGADADTLLFPAAGTDAGALHDANSADLALLQAAQALPGAAKRDDDAPAAARKPAVLRRTAIARDCDIPARRAASRPTRLAKPEPTPVTAAAGSSAARGSKLARPAGAASAAGAAASGTGAGTEGAGVAARRAGLVRTTPATKPRVLGTSAGTAAATTASTTASASSSAAASRMRAAPRTVGAGGKSVVTGSVLHSNQSAHGQPAAASRTKVSVKSGIRAPTVVPPAPTPVPAASKGAASSLPVPASVATMSSLSISLDDSDLQDVHNDSGAAHPTLLPSPSNDTPVDAGISAGALAALMGLGVASPRRAATSGFSTCSANASLAVPAGSPRRLATNSNIPAPSPRAGTRRAPPASPTNTNTNTNTAGPTAAQSRPRRPDSAAPATAGTRVARSGTVGPGAATSQDRKPGSGPRRVRRQSVAGSLLAQHQQRKAQAQEAQPASPVDELRGKWDEVNFLLRGNIENQEQFEQVRAQALAARAFIDCVTLVCDKLDIPKGRLARILLPYNDDTNVRDQASSALILSQVEQEKEPEVVASVNSYLEHHNELMTCPALGRMVDLSRFDSCNDLVLAATELRQLVRVKIADENDLGQAERSVHDIIRFSEALEEALRKLRDGEFEREVQRLREVHEASLANKSEDGESKSDEEPEWKKSDAWAWVQLNVPYGIGEYAFISRYLGYDS